MIVGFPGCGKTTIRKKMIQKRLKNGKEIPVVVCPDDFRYILLSSNQTNKYFDINLEDVIWAVIPSILKSLIIKEKDIIYDATNLSIGIRRSILSLFKNTSYQLICIYFNTSIEDCKKRNDKRKSKVPDDVYERMNISFVEPSIEEGFKKIIIK